MKVSCSKALAALGLSALFMLAPTAQAQVQNGGFETGDFSGWTLRDYRRSGSGLTITPPTSHTQLDLTLQASTPGAGVSSIYRSQVLTTPGTAANTGVNGPTYPFAGNASARVGGNGSLMGTSLEQQYTVALSDVDSVDGRVHLRFAMAPVLNNPGHQPHQQPYFFVEVTNVSKGTQLFQTFNYSNQPGIPWQSVGSYQFTNWQGFDISPGNGLLDVGDQVLLRIFVANCSPSAADHTAQVYLDVAGSKMPGLSVHATGPSTTKPNEQVTYNYNYINNTGVFALGGRVRLAAPITENGLHLDFTTWPSSCTGPHAGIAPRADYIDCPVGDLVDGAGGNFNVTFTVPAAAPTTGPNNVINNGDYDIRGDTVSPFIGPLVKTTILPTATPTVDLGITVSNGGVSSYITGGAVAYTVTATNHGPIDIVGAIISQTLAGVAGTANWTCAPAPGSTATCGAASGSGAISTTGDLPVGQGLVYTVTGITAAAAGTPVVTVVNVAPPAGTSDNIAANNTDGVSTPVSAVQNTLTVNTTGAGTGRVNATPSTLQCPSPGGMPCNSQLLGENQEAYLSAVADPGSIFKNWSGDCTSITGNQCFVRMGTTDLAVTAEFALAWIVTPSITGGTITPNSPQVVEDGLGTSFTITPGGGAPGQILEITTPPGANSCPGTLSAPVGGNYTYTVSPVTQDCAFHVGFVTPAPAITVVKSEASTGPYAAGDVVDYEFLVTNTGNVTLTGVAVNDPLLDAPASCPVTTLAAGADTTCTGSHTVTAAEVAVGVVHNSATASGQPPTPPGGPVPPAVTSPASTTDSATVQNPDIAIVKSVSSAGPYAVGDLIDYAFEVTNTGDVTLTAVSVDDPMLDAPATCPVTTLAPADVVTCTGSHTVTPAEIAAGFVANSATATGQPPTPPGGVAPPAVTSPPSDVVTATAQNPQLDIVKTATSVGPYTNGSRIDYQFVVSNTGDVTLTGVVVNDPLLDVPAACPTTTLAPGDVVTCTGYHTVTAAGIAAGFVHNSATASGTPPAVPGAPASTPITSSRSEVVSPTVQNPGITLVKSVSSTAPYPTGSVITYQFTVTNTGNVTLNGVVVNDPQLDAPASCPTTTLAPGSSTICSGRYTVQAADVAAGYVRNSATATGQPPLVPGGTGSTPLTSPPSEVITPTLHAPALGIVKSVTSSGPYAAGDAIEYRFVVTNTGNLTLSGIVVNDPRLDAPATCPVTTLAPGDATTCAGRYTVTSADVAAGHVHNVATASGTPPALPGEPAPAPITSPPDEVHTPTVQQPGLAMQKSVVSGGPYTQGSVIDYAFQVTNTGSVDLFDIVVNDPQLDAPATCPGAHLAPGASMTCTGQYTVTAANVEAGNVHNVATASGTPPTLPGDPAPTATTSEPSEVTTTIQQRPAITTGKVAQLTVDHGTPGVANVGDVITYSVTVTNTGDVTLDNITVEDAMDGYAPVMLSCTPTTLAPGQTATCPSYDHTVTLADASRPGGNLDNKVVVAANSLGSSTVSVSAMNNAAVQVESDPAQLRVVKTASPRDVKVGDLVRYSLTLHNTGGTPLVDGTVIDTPPAGFSYVDGSLVVGDADRSGQLAGVHPLVIERIDVPVGQSATITYLLRVGAGVRAGIHTNSVVIRDRGDTVSNVATADVQLIADPTLDESLVLGTVFDDRDGDGWQDSATMHGVRAQGGFAPGAYLAGSTTMDRGAGAQPVADASAPLLHGVTIGTLEGQPASSEATPAHRVVISQILTSPDFNGDFVLTSDEGVTVRMDAAGVTTTTLAGQAAKGLTAAKPVVRREVTQVENGYRVDYIIDNQGVDERGIPGVRIASVEGLLVETDQFGRYHLTGIEGGRLERGRNFILKVDPATLPPGTRFSTDNPLLRRVTPGLPVRFDFGVQLPGLPMDTHDAPTVPVGPTSR